MIGGGDEVERDAALLFTPKSINTKGGMIQEHASLSGHIIQSTRWYGSGVVSIHRSDR